jgi:hypothetical protein
VRGTFSQPGPSHPAAGVRLARTLGVTLNMLRAVATYLLALPLVMLAFWCIGSMLYPPTQPMPPLAMALSAAYFAPLILLFGAPGLLIVVVWAGFLGSRAWPMTSLLAGAAALATFAYSNAVMCRIDPMGPDCLGNISFQLTERSPFGGEYAMMFWSTVLSSTAFWLVYRRATPKRTLSLAPHSHEATRGDA